MPTGAALKILSKASAWSLRRVFCRPLSDSPPAVTAGFFEPRLLAITHRESMLSILMQYIT
jgi:hypothetical protein